MKKNQLLVILFFLIRIDTFSQDYIMIEHIGSSDKYLPALMINKIEITELYNFDSICHTFTSCMSCNNLELDSIRYNLFKRLMIKTIASTAVTARLGYTDFRILIFSGKKKKYLYSSSERSFNFFTELRKKVEKYKIDDKLLTELNYILKYLRLNR